MEKLNEMIAEFKNDSKEIRMLIEKAKKILNEGEKKDAIKKIRKKMKKLRIKEEMCEEEKRKIERRKIEEEKKDELNLLAKKRDELKLVNQKIKNVKILTEAFDYYWTKKAERKREIGKKLKLVYSQPYPQISATKIELKNKIKSVKIIIRELKRGERKASSEDFKLEREVLIFFLNALMMKNKTYKFRWFRWLRNSLLKLNVKSVKNARGRKEWIKKKEIRF